jgi:hypothetical protein
MRSLITRLTLAVCCLSLFTTAHAALDRSKPDFEVYGFAQADYIQDFQRVDPNWAATLRASKIPTTEGYYGADGQALISPRQSRLGAQGNIMTAQGPVMAKVEFDFFGVGVDAGQTTIRFRHGYGEWNGILAGQTNSLFMDDDMWPNIIDYWGPSGMVFLRNPQIRYTPKIDGDRTFAVAIEHPSNDVDPGEIRQVDPSLGGTTISSVSQLPDLTSRFRQNTQFGYVQLGGILRRLGYEVQGQNGTGPHGSSLGWGFDLTSIVKVKGKDQILLSGVYGAGIANYMNDGGMDLAAQRGGANGAESAAVPLFGLMVYYDHWWNDKFSSTIGYGRTQVENTDLQSASAYHSGEYASTNLIYYPTKSVFFGGEFLWGQRRDSGGAMGTDTRIQVSANYKFSSKDVFGK